jgi:hypothetical protein
MQQQMSQVQAEHTQECKTTAGNKQHLHHSSDQLTADVKDNLRLAMQRAGTSTLRTV